MASYSRKGQIGMMELLMVMVIIGIITAIGIYIFYGEFIKNTGEKGREMNEQERAVLISMFGRIPEMQCSKNGNDEDYCIDTIKAVGARNVIRSNKAYYSNILGYRNVKIEAIYPQKNNVICDKDNYPGCGTFAVYDNAKPNAQDKQIVSVLVSLYYPHENKYRVGRFIIEEFR